MNKKIKIISFSSVIIFATCLSFCLFTQSQFNIYHVSEGGEQTVTFDNNYTPTSSSEYVSEASKTVGYTSLNFTKVKTYYDAGGFCTLNVDGTIEKTQAFNNLHTFRACGIAGGRLQITTSFYDDFSEPYIYDYVLEENWQFSPIDVVGNYLKIKAISVCELAWVRINYGCDSPASPYSGVTYTDEDDYLALRLGEDNDNAFVDVKLTSANALDAQTITLRNTDNLDEFAVTCCSLTERGNNNYIATFNISSLNWNSGLWTQYTYPGRVYVNNVRVDGTENGNIYVHNRSITPKTITNNGKTCAYTIGLSTWGTGGFSTISWINNVDESSYFQYKGVRFVQMGDDGKAKYDHKFEVIVAENKVYFYLYGWVKTIEEAELISGRYERFVLKTQTGSTTEQIRNKSFNCETSLCDYESADGGYKITLVYNVKALRGEGNIHDLSAIMALYYDGLPYCLRGDQNDGLLHTTACNTAGSGNSLTDQVGHDWYYYQAYNFYDWVQIKLTHA